MMNTAGVSARDLAKLFVDVLNLQDVDPAYVDLAGPLFGAGLGLDSLDMLEISLVVEQRFGIKLKAEDPQAERIFSSLESLSEYISRTRAGG